MAGGRRGPAPEPAAVKKAKGNSGRRPIATAEIEAEANKAAEEAFPSSGGIQPPVWMNEDGRAIWESLVYRLSAMKILQLIDAQTFARYCQDFGRWVKLQKQLDDEGTTYESESPHGKYMRANPAFMQSDRLNRSLMMMESGFALNPADRQRLFAARSAAANQGGLFDQPDVGDDNSKGGSAIGMLN